jgi:hypothetical protein
MSKTCAAVITLFMLSSIALCQDRAKWEIFGGYQYTYADFGVIQDAATALASNYGETASVDHNLTMTGGTFSFQKNIGKRWAAVLDIGGATGTKDGDLSRYFQLLGYIGSGETQLSTFRPSAYTIMGGPQLDLWKYRELQVFVRGMGGVSRSVLGMDDTTRKALNFLAPNFKTTATDPAVMGGAGVQYPVYRHIFIRATADYVHPFSSSSQNYLRISAGVGLERIGKLF